MPSNQATSFTISHRKNQTSSLWSIFIYRGKTERRDILISMHCDEILVEVQDEMTKIGVKS